MLDDLNELKTFCCILSVGSLSAAARELDTSVAVVSKRLKSLEQRVGVELIHRTTRALSATEEGERLRNDVERALEALAIGEARLVSGRDEVFGTLTVVAPVSFGRRHVAPVLLQLSEDHPQLKVSLGLDDSLVDLVADGVDIAIRIGQPADSTLRLRKLADNRRILVASTAYLERYGRPTTPEALKAHAFIRHGSFTANVRLINDDGRAASGIGQTRLSVNNADAAYDWARAGQGILIKSQADVAADLAAGTIERVLPEWHLGEAPIMALYPMGKQLPRKTRLFLDAMVAALADIRP